MSFFEERLQKLQQKNALVVLRTAGGAYDTQMLQELVQGYNMVDLSLPALRMQVEQNPLGFAQELQLPVHLANLHYTPSLLHVILASELPLGKLLASCSQDYYLKALAKENVLFLDLPLSEPMAGPAFLPTEEQMEALTGKAERRDVVQGILQGSGA